MQMSRQDASLFSCTPRAIACKLSRLHSGSLGPASLPLGIAPSGKDVLSLNVLQKHVARALWHLAAASETRQLLPERGPALALQRLAQGSRSLQSKDLAQQALRRIYDDALLRDRLPPEVLASINAVSNSSTSSLPELTISGRISCNM